MTMQKVAIISDEHGPRRDHAVMDAFIAANKNTPHIVRNGDLFEGEEASSFPGPYPLETLVEEYNNNVDYTDNLLTRLPNAQFYHTLGNHPERLRRLIQKRAPIAQLFGEFDLLWHHCQGHRFEQVPDPQNPQLKKWKLVPHHTHFPKRIQYTPGHNAYVLRVGTNCLVMHAAKALKLSSSQARLWFFEFVLQRFPDARLVFQGHTHRQCDHPMGPYRYIETGCACRPGGYEEAFGRSGRSPIQRGWAECYYNPKTDMVDLDSARFISCGATHYFNPSSF